MIENTFFFTFFSDGDSVHKTQELSLKQFVFDNVSMEKISSFGLECPLLEKSGNVKTFSIDE